MKKIFGIEAEFNITADEDICKGIGKGIEKGSITISDILKQCSDMELIWKRKEHTLTDRERAYLKAYSYDYEWIARDENGTIWTYKNKPYKSTTYWKSIDKDIDDDICKFIKWEDEEPYNIKDLLGEE